MSLISTKDWKVLLVDDEEEFASSLKERLCLRGIQAEAVCNGEEALQKMAIDLPEVVLLDVLLPGMGGLEVLERVKNAFPQVEVILLTGLAAAEENIKNGLRLGAASYLIKPVTIEAVIVEILDVLRVPKSKQTSRSETKS